MRIARTFTTLVAVAASAAIAAGPALAEPAPPVPVVPVAPAPAAAAPAAPAAAAPAAATAAAPAAAAPAAAPAGAAPAGTSLVSTANAVPAGSQPALAELAKIPGVQEIISTGQLPTTDVATLVKMFGSDPNAQKLMAQVLAGQTATGTGATAAESTTPDEPLKFPVAGAINDAFTKDGGQKKYGQPVAAEKDLAGGGKVQEFTNGTIYWNPKVNGGKAAGVTGAIRELYLKEGGPSGKLGMPVMSELTVGGATAGSVAGAYNDFQNGSIVWSPEGGAQIVSGKIKDQWVKGGGAFGVGYPKGPAKPGPGGVLTQEFTKGGVLKA